MMLNYISAYMSCIWCAAIPSAGLVQCELGKGVPGQGSLTQVAVRDCCWLHLESESRRLTVLWGCLIKSMCTGGLGAGCGRLVLCSHILGGGSRDPVSPGGILPVCPISAGPGRCQREPA